LIQRDDIFCALLHRGFAKASFLIAAGRGGVVGSGIDAPVVLLNVLFARVCDLMREEEISRQYLPEELDCFFQTYRALVENEGFIAEPKLAPKGAESSLTD